MTNQATVFRKGDRVELLEELGPLKAGTPGLVVEVYETDGVPTPVTDPTTRLLEWPLESEFPIAVAFPTLRLVLPPEGVGWVCDDLDQSGFHAGDVVPMRASEVKVTGNLND